jgi:hypothetical protein
MADNPKRAGRPKGVKDSKPRRSAARVIASIALTDGITPLDVMLTLMVHAVTELNQAIERADATPEEIKALRDEAGKWAEKAGPYVNARLSSQTVDWTGKMTVHDARTLADTARAEAIKRGIDLAPAIGRIAGTLQN